MHKNAWPPGLDARKRAKRGKGRERQKWEKDERKGEWRRDGRDEKGQERGGGGESISRILITGP